MGVVLIERLYSQLLRCSIARGSYTLILILKYFYGAVSGVRARHEVPVKPSPI